MTRVIGVHGIAQQYRGTEVLKASWLPAMRSGLELAGGPALPDGGLKCVFYGDLFRPPGDSKDDTYPPYDAEHVEDWEWELLEEWRACLEPDEEADKARTPFVVQQALAVLSGSRFFGSLATAALIGQLKQVRAYLHDPDVKREVRARLEEFVDEDTRVIVGHSLGSIIAYEVLCAHPEWNVKAFVTLGSPLGIRNLVFAHLDPAPERGEGRWPDVEQWTNIADKGDIVALEKKLATLFTDRVVDVLVHNGAKAHAIEPYLTAEETGRAIAAGLR